MNETYMCVTSWREILLPTCNINTSHCLECIKDFIYLQFHNVVKLHKGISDQSKVKTWLHIHDVHECEMSQPWLNKKNLKQRWNYMVYIKP